MGKKCFMFVYVAILKIENLNFVLHCYGEGSAVILAESQDFVGYF